jgi:large subunit ribosomal protein L4
MIKAPVFNLKGEAAGSVVLPKIFETNWNPALVQQVVQSMLSNQRQILAHAKGRGEVRGGGKKPWAQKGTGRSRHGSIRSPLWKGGGTTFGPTKEKNFLKKINKKMLKEALFSVLSKKAAEGELKIMEMDLPKPKTKPLAQAVKKIVNGRSAILVSAGSNRNLILASRNLPKISCLTADTLNVYELLKHQEILLDRKALEKYESPT